MAAAAAAPFLELRGEMAIKNNLRRKRGEEEEEGGSGKRKLMSDERDGSREEGRNAEMREADQKWMPIVIILTLNYSGFLKQRRDAFNSTGCINSKMD